MQGLKVQEIEIGKERAVIVPQRTWRRLLELLEDKEDVRLYDEAKAKPAGTTIEHDELLRRLGRSPLRYLRGRAGLTQAELAKKAGLTQSFIAKVEASEKKLSETSRRKLARALGVPEARLVW
jgi:ribosome-binding protein aMBF1 (putative translation factor)